MPNVLHRESGEELPSQPNDMAALKIYRGVSYTLSPISKALHNRPVHFLGSWMPPPKCKDFNFQNSLAGRAIAERALGLINTA